MMKIIRILKLLRRAHLLYRIYKKRHQTSVIHWKVGHPDEDMRVLARHKNGLVTVYYYDTADGVYTNTRATQVIPRADVLYWSEIPK